MDDLLSEFLTETSESLERLDAEIVRLERNPNDPELLGVILRLMHTIKGTCGFLSLHRLESLAHASENVLGNFRDGVQQVTPDAVSLVLQALDRIKSLLAALEQSETEPAGEDSALLGGLEELYHAARNGRTSGGLPAKAAAVEPELEPAKRITRRLVPAPVSAGAPTSPAERLIAASSAARSGPAPSHVAAVHEPVVTRPSIRVTVDAIENLMTTVSELVLTRNQLLRMAGRHDDAELKAPLQRLSHVTSELRELVMKTRLQPIGNAWSKLPRIVRDLAIELGKQIELEMHGADTEIDRQVLDMIKDPLTHMVRNSADHGIEMPDERRRAGKDATGRIVLDARHEGGRVVVEIRDDGRGIDVAKVRRRAASVGLAAESELAAMSEHRLQEFIFRPGFSTADKVTAISGRGVGMDVVRANVDQIGGQIEIASVEGRGSTFTITIPLTLAIVPALIVECAGERFAISQPSIVELVRVSKASGHHLETIGRTPVLRLHGRLLPLISLAALLRLDPAGGGDGGEAIRLAAGGEPFVVVAQIGPARFGLVVDRIHDTEEIVVKPVAPMLRHIGIYSGATILGDGSVIMILDPHGIAEAVGKIAVADQAVPMADADTRVAERAALLVFRAGSSEPKAVPLALVARLETIEASAIETSSGVPVVQYRDRLMPLVSIDAAWTLGLDGRQSVIVLGDDEANFGLVVDEIVDIVEDRLDLQLGAARDGVLGSAIVDGKATEIIDVAAYFERVHRGGPSGRGRQRDTGAGDRERLLLVDDSSFFVSLLIPILTSAGYAVTAVQAPSEALDLRDRGETFDVIVTDIDMPGMNGFEFARAVRADGPWKDVPLIALASRATPADFAEGREAGFVDYVAKLDRAALLESLSQSGELWRGAA